MLRALQRRRWETSSLVGATDPYQGYSKYYVRKTGNDTTGDGSFGNPWLTVTKAAKTVPIAGKNVIYIGPGTYAEKDSTLNYFYIKRNFLDWTVFTAEVSSNPPVITGNGDITYGVRTDLTCTYYKFVNIIFDDTDVATGKGYGTFYLTGSTLSDHFWFENCTIRFTLRQNYGRYGIFGNTDTGKALSNVTIKNCTFVANSTDTTKKGRGLRINENTLSSITGIVVQNCNIVMAQGTPVEFVGLVDFLIEGGVYSSGDSYGLLIGTDGSGTFTQSGTIDGATVTSTTSHAVLVGGPCNGITVKNCTITGGNQGLVLKECTNITVFNNIINYGTDNAFYCKAATNVTATYNTIYNNVAVVARIGWNSSTGNKSGNVTLTNNIINGAGSAQLLYWGGDSEDSGGGVCDYNTYSPDGGNKYGKVRADPDVLTLAELRSAWAGYGDGSNDSHSVEV